MPRHNVMKITICGRRACESYLHRQDLWEIVGKSEVTPLEDVSALRWWKIKAGKVMFMLMITVDELLENDTKLQVLENKLLAVVQCRKR